MGALLSRLLAAPQLPRRLEHEASPSSPDPFSVNFTVSAHHRKIWISPDDGSYPETELRVKGANWAGFQASGCVHELWKHNVSDYVDYLVRHRYNAVRLPISGWIVQQPSFVIEGDYICGRSFAGLESMDVLDRVLAALRAAGLFVMLDMHTLSYPEYNNRIWCLSGHSGCSPYWENSVFTAWRILARRYCEQPHVILADLFNEPAGTNPNPSPSPDPNPDPSPEPDPDPDPDPNPNLNPDPDPVPGRGPGLDLALTLTRCTSASRTSPTTPAPRRACQP